MPKRYICLRSSVGSHSPALLIFVVIALLLTACGPKTLVVGLEPTPTPTPLPTPVVHSYVNDEYGFTFHYPETWTLVDEPQRITLSQGTLVLTISYGWASNPGFRPMGGRTGLPAGDLIYGGKVLFLERTIPAQVLTYQRQDKMVLYGETGLVEVVDLVFSIWLEQVGGASYAELDIPKELQAQAIEILASFERINASGKPPASTATPAPRVEQKSTPGAARDQVVYVNDEYQFAFIYPPSWELEEIPPGQYAQGGAAANAIHLTTDSLRLVIQFKRVGEASVLGVSGRPAGEIEEGGTVTVLGREISSQVLVQEGKVKSVFLRGRFEDLELYVQLDHSGGSDTAYEAIDIPESAQSAMGAILRSLHRTGELKSFAPDTLTYQNAPYGFSFQYPASWTVEEIAGETMEDGVKLADAVSVRQGKFAIVVQYRRKSDPQQIAWGGPLVPGGLGYAEAFLGDRVTLLGEETHKYVWAYDGDTKAVAVSTTGENADLLLSITLADSTVRVIQDAQATAVPDAAITALDQVLSSFAVTQS